MFINNYQMTNNNVFLIGLFSKWITRHKGHHDLYQATSNPILRSENRENLGRSDYKSVCLKPTFMTGDIYLQAYHLHLLPKQLNIYVIFLLINYFLFFLQWRRRQFHSQCRYGLDPWHGVCPVHGDWPQSSHRRKGHPVSVQCLLHLYNIKLGRKTWCCLITSNS